MLRFTDTDFQPLATFSLAWRWTDERWSNLPQDILRQIRPFTQAKAKEMWRIAGHYALSDGPRLNLFECAPWIDASVDLPNTETKVRRWLIDICSDGGAEVIVSWDQAAAVLTQWDIFCKYWDDFCYPASDDVTVFPPSIDWLVFYQHGESFVFGKRRGAGTAEKSLDGSAGSVFRNLID